MTTPLGYGLDPYGTSFYGSLEPLNAGGQLSVAVFHVDPGTGVYTPLPDLVALDVSPQRNAPGAVSLTYPTAGRNADLLRAIADDDIDVEIAIWLYGRDAESLRAVLAEASGDDADPGADWTFAGTFLEGRMAEALVGLNNADPDFESPFPSATAGTIVRTLMQRCQTRGELTDITYATFSNTLDTAGQPWASVATTTFGPKDTLLSVLDALVAAGLCEWQVTADHKLRVYNPDTLGADRTVGATPTTLWVGSNVTDGPHKHSTRDSATHLLVEGKDGLYTEVFDATALARRGRRITKVVSAGNVEDLATLQVYGAAQMQLLGHGTKELTHGLPFGTSAPLPLTDFTVGDWIYTGNERGLSRRRVQQWVVSLRAGQPPEGSITLNDLIADSSVKLSQRIDALERGLMVVGTSTSSSENDTLAPAAPVGVVASSLAYVDPAGQPLAQVTAGWNAVVTNSDGTAIDDLGSYRVEWRFAESGFSTDWQFAGTSQAATLSWSGLPQNVHIEVRVAALDWRGNISAFSTAASLVTESDSTPPPTPSAPVPWNQQGVIVIPWDGKGSLGEVMPGDFVRVTIHKSLSASFTATSGNQLPIGLRGAGTAVYEPAPSEQDVALFFVLVAYDRLGNASPQSAVGTATPHLPAIDVGDILIDAANLADGAVTSIKLASDAVTAAKIATDAVTTPALADAAVTSAILAANAVTAPAIAANAVTTPKIQAGAVDAGTIAAGAITTGKIATGAVDAGTIAAGAITTPKIQAGAVTAATIAAGAVAADKIAANAITTKNLTIATFGDNAIPNGSFEDADPAAPTRPASWAVTDANGGSTITLDTTSGNVMSGSNAFKAALPATFQVVSLRSAWFPTTPGRQWLFEVHVKASRAYGGFVALIEYTAESTPTTVSTTDTKASNGAFPTAWTLLQYPSTAPLTTGGQPTKWVRITLQAHNSDSALLDVWFDEIRARPVVGSALIADAAIGTAKIANAAITNAQVGNLDVGKLTSGTGTFAMLMAGRIESSSTGAGWVLDGAGIYLFDTDENTTVEFDAATGDAYMRGTLEARQTANDRIVVQPSGAGASGVSVSEISFFSQATRPGYINGVTGSGGTLLGMNSGRSGDFSGALQTTVRLFPASFDIFVNTAPYPTASSANQARGGKVAGGTTDARIECTDSAADVQAQVSVHSDGTVQAFGKWAGFFQAGGGNDSVLVPVLFTRSPPSGVHTVSYGATLSTTRVITATFATLSSSSPGYCWVSASSSTSFSVAVDNQNTGGSLMIHNTGR